VLFSKALASQATTLDAKLFAIRLSIAKTTSMDIKHIIFITDSLCSVIKTMDLSVYSGQAYFLDVGFILILFFSYSLNYKIGF